jgi:HNH endonuclease
MPYELDFLQSYDRDTVAAELRRIAEVLGKASLTSTDIHKYGRVSPCVVVRRFGSMTAALGAAGLRPSQHWTNEELLKMLADLWAKTLADLGRSPQMEDLRAYGVPVTWAVYKNRFGGWKKALLAASRFTDTGDMPEIDLPARRSTLSVRTRFLVFQRDSFTCRICKVSGVKLELDHVKPYRLGGTDDMDNLQTLCVPCNRGKRNSMQ